ncbi:MAG: ABC transporter permease [Lachnotalea sp.]
MIINSKKFLSLQMEVNEEDFLPVSKEEQKHLVQMRENVSYWKDAWRRLKQNKIAMVSLVVIVAVFLFAFIGPMLSPYTYDMQNRGDESLFPCQEYIFGTDQFGRDLLVRTMIGTRISLIIGVGAALLVVIIGSIYGAISGLIGGKVDNIMMRICELIYSVPDILVIILLQITLKDPLTALVDAGKMGPLQKLGPGIIAIFIVYALLYWVGMARIIRGQVLQLKEMEFISAAKALGASNKRLILKHLLPNCTGQLVVTTMLQIPSAIFTEAFLSFLGLGVSMPMASLGSLSAAALDGLSSYPYKLIFPAATISIIILAFNLFGDGLRDALDPKMKK